jgi:hypothetical protein
MFASVRRVGMADIAKKVSKYLVKVFFILFILDADGKNTLL